MGNLSTRNQQTRESARRANGEFGSWEAEESAATLIPGYTSAGARALQAISQDKPAITADEAPDSGTSDPGYHQNLGLLRDGLSDTLKEDVRQSYNDGAFTDDGEPPEDDIDDLELSPDAAVTLEEMTREFASENYEDLKTFSDGSAQCMTDVGADTYLAGSGSGMGFASRIADDRIVAQNHLRSLSEELSEEEHDHEINRCLNTVERSGVDPVVSDSGHIDVEASLERIADGQAPSVKTREAAERLDAAATETFRDSLEQAYVGDDRTIHLAD